jgi:hypothetical protein
VQPDGLEGEGEQRPRRLGREALALMRGVDDEAELALPVRLARPAQRYVTDEIARSTKHRRGTQPFSLGPE